MEIPIERDSRERTPEARRKDSREFQPELDREPQSRDKENTRTRGIIVNDDQMRAMADIGRFRVMADRDLAAYRYPGKPVQKQCDFQALEKQGLVQQKTVWTGRDKEYVKYWALTKEGRRYVKRHKAVEPEQAIYAGFVKPKELAHDAAIYKMFELEREKLESAGGKVKRVVLDFEIKKKVYSPLAKARALPEAGYRARQTEIAEEHGLKVVNGHITLPDLRVEYTDRAGIAAHVDLEVASESYHGSHAAEKAAAGFTIYAGADTAARLTRVLEEREITAEILSL